VFVIWFDDVIFILMFEYLGIFILKILKTFCKAPLGYAKVLPKPYDEFS
jgi:hypothetical protein